MYVLKCTKINNLSYFFVSHGLLDLLLFSILLCCGFTTCVNPETVNNWEDSTPAPPPKGEFYVVCIWCGGGEVTY